MANWDNSTFYDKSEINNGKEFSVSSVPTLSDINKIVSNILYLHSIPQTIVTSITQKLFTPNVNYSAGLQSLSIDNSANGNFAAQTVLRFISTDNNGNQVVKEFSISSDTEVFSLTGQGLEEGAKYTLEYYAKGSLADSEQGTIDGITLTPTSAESYGLRFALLGTGEYQVQGASENKAIVVIPNSYNGKRVVRIADRAFRGSRIERLIIEDNSDLVIGAEAFADCTQLREIIGASDVWVQDSVTHWTPSDWFTVKEIGANCFQSANITGISLKAPKIGSEAFIGSSIAIANLDTTNIAIAAFEQCNIQKVFLRNHTSSERISITGPNFSNNPILRTPESIVTFPKRVILGRGVSFGSIEYNSNELWDF